MLHSAKEGVPAALRNVDLSSLLCLGLFLSHVRLVRRVTLVVFFGEGGDVCATLNQSKRRKPKELLETKETKDKKYRFHKDTNKE